METNLFTPQERAAINAGLDDADAALTGFLVLIRTQINQSRTGPLARKLIAKILRTLLVPAEAPLRRLVHILADIVAPLPARQGGRPPCQGPRARLPADRARLVPGLTPRPAPAPRRESDPFALEARFLRRLEALEYAFNDPLREARRLQRRRTRAKARQSLRSGLPRGLVGSPDTYLLNLYENLHAWATRPADTS